MSRSRLLFCLVLCATILTSGTRSAAAQNVSTGVLTANEPVFLLPDATRTPLTTLVKGTTVRIIQRQGDWYRIEFRDPQFGNRVGYVRAASLTLLPPAPPKPPSPSPVPPSATAKPAGQRPAARKTRLPVTFSLNAGLQTTSRNFEAASTFEESVETGSLSSSYASDSPYLVDVGVQAGVWRSLSLGIAASWTSKSQDSNLTAEVPHPFFFDRPRLVSGVVTGLRREEFALHLNAAWTVAVSRSTHIAVFGGPTYFQLTQGLVTDVAVTEEYPYDTASFLSAATTEETAKRWGYNAGVDVAQGVWKYVGVGFIARYSRASLTFPIASEQEIDVDAGGLQASGGLRLRW